MDQPRKHPARIIKRVNAKKSCGLGMPSLDQQKIGVCDCRLVAASKNEGYTGA